MYNHLLLGEVLNIATHTKKTTIYMHLLQISFIEYIIFPLWETWAELVYPDAQDVLDNISAIKDYWAAKNEESNSPSEEDVRDIIVIAADTTAVFLS